MSNFDEQSLNTSNTNYCIISKKEEKDPKDCDDSYKSDNMSYNSKSNNIDIIKSSRPLLLSMLFNYEDITCLELFGIDRS